MIEHKLTFDSDGTAKCSCGSFAWMTVVSGKLSQADKKAARDYHRDHKRRALARERKAS